MLLEHLSFVLGRAPFGGVSGVAEQVLGAVGDAMERGAEALAAEVFIVILGRLPGWLAQRVGEGVVAGAELLEPAGPGFGQLLDLELFGAQFGLDLSQGEEEKLLGEGGLHG